MNESLPSTDTAPNELKDLPLWRAALAWSDPVLVQALRDAHMDYFRLSHWTAPENPFPTRFEQTSIAQTVIAAAVGVDTGFKEAAGTKWMRCAGEVAEDLRRRIAHGDITLTGLQTKPHLERNRSAVPPAWAVLLAFNWTQNSVTAKDAELVDIVCERTPATRAGRADAIDDASEPVQGRGVQPPKGRPGFPLEEMVSLVADRLHLREPNNQREAERLLALFLERYPGRKLPAHKTTVRHVGRIYVIAGQRAATLKA